MNLGLSDNGLMIIPVGICFFVLYYLTFYFLIKKKNIPVMGQVEDKVFAADAGEEEQSLKLTHANYEYMARKIVQYIGGKENIVSYENCMTRIRLELKDTSLIDEEKIKQTGAHGVIKVNDRLAQIVIGPQVTNVMKEFEKIVEES